MARSRRTASVSQTTVTHEPRRVTMGVTTVDPTKIAELLSKSRSKGQYDTELKKFWESDEAGVQVDLENGVFAGKKPQSIKTGFESAAKREGAPEGAKDSLRVIISDDQVYLIRTDLT